MVGKIQSTATELIQVLRENGNQVRLEGMNRFGIQAVNGLGCSMPFLRKLASQVKKDHFLALELWETQIHEARILASLVDIPTEVSENQMINWVKDFNSWDICDQVIGNLFRKVGTFPELIPAFCNSKEEYIRRAGFAGMAILAVHQKNWEAEKFQSWFPLLKQGLNDDRNFVKKGVSWALRQLGKRGPEWRLMVLSELDNWEENNSGKAARWILSDVRRELASL